MAEANATQNGNNDADQAKQASAGAPQRVPQARGLAAAPATTPSAAELDARQQAKGLKRKSGPPLVDRARAVALAADAAVEDVEETEVNEPRKQDK